MHKLQLCLILPTLSLLTACGETDPNTPPQILLGDSICTECGMIVSDERFGTATIVEGDRGSQALIFDDFNCQNIFEHKHPELKIITRWTRDYDTLEWFHARDGWFVQSSQIRSPMASGLVGFKARERAQTYADSIGAEVIEHASYNAAALP